jgi:RNA polymerase-binding transcription factor DksA
MIRPSRQAPSFADVPRAPIPELSLSFSHDRAGRDVKKEHRDGPKRAPGVQMQFGKRAGDHTAYAVLQMQRTIIADQLQQVAADMDRVIDKLKKDTYGICDECGQPIGEERLEAITWALRCVRCQTGGHSR